jgi:hypothetical protein
MREIEDKTDYEELYINALDNIDETETDAHARGGILKTIAEKILTPYELVFFNAKYFSGEGVLSSRKMTKYTKKFYTLNARMIKAIHKKIKDNVNLHDLDIKKETDT